MGNVVTAGSGGYTSRTLAITVIFGSKKDLKRILIEGKVMPDLCLQIT